MGMQIDKLDTANVEKNAEKWEKVVRKLRAGMMPPSGMRRPDHKTYEAMIVYLETELDKHRITELPPPGIHRLNRTEYANAIHDLLNLDIDPSKFLPSDDSTRGFDNVAGSAVAFAGSARRLHHGRGEDQPPGHGRHQRGHFQDLPRARRQLAGLLHRRHALRHPRRPDLQL